MTRTSHSDFDLGPVSDPALQWDTKCKLIGLTEVCALPSSVLVTSAAEGEGGYVFTPVCLFVCLCAGYLKKLPMDLDKILVGRLGV